MGIWRGEERTNRDNICTMKRVQLQILKNLEGEVAQTIALEVENMNGIRMSRMKHRRSCTK